MKTLLPFRWEQRLFLKDGPLQLAGAVFGVIRTQDREGSWWDSAKHDRKETWQV